MNKFTLKELGREEKFDPCSIVRNVPFTQASFYGDWQESLGRKVRRFVVSDGGKSVAYFQIIKYPLISGKSYLYIPYGPVISNDNNLDLNALIEYLSREIKDISKKENAVFTRLDFTPSLQDTLLDKYFSKAPSYTYHSAYFQPRVEWHLGLMKDENELLADMHKNTRYSILTASKREITTEIITSDFQKYFDLFYELMLETSKRNGFSLHPKNYYENIFRHPHEISAYISIAKFQEKILAIDLVIIYGNVANYVFSGSSTEERNRMPAYAALWKAICYAKEKGSNQFNFGGITAEGDNYRGWDGLTAFKKKFGGNEVRHSDFYDIVIQPFWYHIYNFRKRMKRLRS
jgi:lipid II:glycine glycyltransferase (peptidoglycan interpeptide bridge formation enzyme)